MRKGRLTWRIGCLFLAASAVLPGGIAFEPNLGQVAGRSVFAAKTSFGSVLIYTNRLEFAGKNGSRTALEFVGASLLAHASGESVLGSVNHYVLGSDPSRWVWSVPRYERLRVKDVYRGIDLVYREAQGRIEFDLEFAPGANVSDVKLKLPDRTRIESNGTLRTGSLVLHRPIAWQTKSGKRVPVAAHLAISKDGTARFQLGPYDRQLPLTIDPVVDFATFFGGSDNEGDSKIITASDGAIFLAGTTLSFDFPANIPSASVSSSKAYVARLKQDASAAEWSILLGGSKNETLLDLKRDAEDNLYILGRTTSLDFPATPESYRATPRPPFDLFVAKLDGKTGKLLASTFLGVSSESRGILALSENGDVFVGGGLDYDGITATPGAYQTTLYAGTPSLSSFVLKMNRTLTVLQFASYWHNGAIAAMAADNMGNLAIGGTASGTSQSGPPPFQPVAPLAIVNQRPVSPRQAYIAKLNSSGSAVMFATLLHGEGQSSGVWDLKLEKNGLIHLVGASAGSKFPQVDPLQLDALPPNFPPVDDTSFSPFLATLSADGSTLIRSTLLYGPEYTGGSFSYPKRLVLMPDLSQCILGLGTEKFQQSVGGLASVNNGYGENGYLSCVDGNANAFRLKTRLPGGGTYLDATAGPDGSVLLAGIADRSFVASANVVQPRLRGAPLTGALTDNPRDAFVMRVSLKNPAPKIRTLFPDALIVTTSFSDLCSIRIIGSGFVAGMQVRWNGQLVSNQFVEQDQLLVPAFDCAWIRRGENQVQVSTEGPGGGSSEAVFLGMNGISGSLNMSPAIVEQGSPDTRVSISGNIFPDSVVLWNGVIRPSQYVADTFPRGHLELTVSSSELAEVGTLPVVVRNPGPGGGDSVAVQFTIRPATLSALVLSNPQPMSYFGRAFPLPTQVSLTGNGFTPETKAFWDGVEVPAQFVSTNRISISPPEYDVSHWGAHDVFVSNGSMRSLVVRVFVVRTGDVIASAFDAKQQRVYVLTPSLRLPDVDLLVLDAKDGSIISTIQAPYQTNYIALSDDGRFVYVHTPPTFPEPSGRILRYDTTIREFDLEWNLVKAGKPSYAESITTVAGAPETLIVGLREGGIVIYDRDQLRPVSSMDIGFKPPISTTVEVLLATNTRIYLGPRVQFGSPCWVWLDYDSQGMTTAQPACSAEPPETRRYGSLSYLGDGFQIYAAGLPRLSVPTRVSDALSLAADLSKRRAWQYSAYTRQLLSLNLDTSEYALKALLELMIYDSVSLFPASDGLLVSSRYSIMLIP